MQDFDNPTSMYRPESQEENLGQDVPSFPFLTKIWLNGKTIAIVFGLLAVLGSGSFVGIKSGNGLGTFVGIFIGAIYGVIIWFSIRFYSEMAGVWLNMEVSHTDYSRYSCEDGSKAE
jgi:amino acid permease